MLRKTLMVAVLILASGTAVAQWQDVGYVGTLAKGAVYCTSQRNIEEFGGFAQDGDEDGANRMVRKGDCRISSGMQVNVFQEDGFLSNFLSPSGKAFYTFKAFIQ